ncbi:hypothetical protein CVU37_04035 [candidate division BRC1 bacterium HGW-BRC1-1]|jgi:hypothetical protein|nr:MAG: hypothetical protein CVU37_04035 [candidate division BRC1 bacterium HGW-BRC1-1]
MSVEPSNHDDAVEGVLHYLSDYIATRGRQASRMHPPIAMVIGEIVWMQMAHMRQVLEKLKTFAPDRVRVADALTGVDDTRRRAILSHTDQNAVVYEIIDRQDQAKSSRVVDMAIHDTRTLFRSLNPSLETVVQLVQHWSYWDLSDAADLFHFDKNVRRISAIQAISISDDMRKKYRAAMRLRSDDPFTDDDIFKFELTLMNQIVTRFVQKRKEEEAYVTIICRDELPVAATNQEIMKTARHMMALEALEDESKDVDPAMHDYFARAMHMDHDMVTREKMIEFVRRNVAEAKRTLKQVLAEDRNLGEPYDYKDAQGTKLKERFTEICGRFAFGNDYLPGVTPPPQGSVVEA